MIVYSSGQLSWTTQDWLEAFCYNEINTDDVWADQLCSTEFGSFTYDGHTLDIDFFDTMWDEHVSSDYAKNCQTEVRIKRNNPTITFAVLRTTL